MSSQWTRCMGGASPAPPISIPALSRFELASLPTRFGGGVWAQTSIGLLPSWGVEIGMLGVSDRKMVYAAHRAAGAKAIWFSLFTHYQEPGVSYPNGIAASNDFTKDEWVQAVAIAQEIAANGLYPFIHLGGDELGSAWVRTNIQSFADALRRGGLIGKACLTPTFDSNADDDWCAYPEENWAQANLDIRAALGNDFALANWLPAGWARLGVSPSTPVAEAEACVDRWSLEGPGGRGQFLAPWPAVIGARDDGEHGFVPVFASDATAHMQFIQVVGRRVAKGKWKPPADAPYGVAIDGHVVSCDENPPPTYSTPGQTCIWEESHTYDWTHQNGITAEEIDLERAGALASGCDNVG